MPTFSWLAPDTITGRTIEVKIIIENFVWRQHRLWKKGFENKDSYHYEHSSCTYQSSYCWSLEPSSLPWVSMIILPKVEKCSIVPHHWKYKSKQKRKPSNSTTKARKRFVKYSQYRVLLIPDRSIVAISMVHLIHLSQTQSPSVLLSTLKVTVVFFFSEETVKRRAEISRSGFLWRSAFDDYKSSRWWRGMKKWPFGTKCLSL